MGWQLSVEGGIWPNQQSKIAPRELVERGAWGRAEDTRLLVGGGTRAQWVYLLASLQMAIGRWWWAWRLLPGKADIPKIPGSTSARAGLMGRAGQSEGEGWGVSLGVGSQSKTQHKALGSSDVHSHHTVPHSQDPCILSLKPCQQTAQERQWV